MTQRLSAALRRKELLPLLLLFVVVAAFAVRTSGVDWDGGSLYHPDERSIYMRAACMYDTLTEQSGWQGCADPAFPQDTPGIPSPGTLFDAEASPLNPHWFPIGSILIYLLVGVRGVLGLFMESVSLQDLAVAGRLMAALADTGSVMFLYLVGRRLFGAGAGLLAAALYAFSAMYIQLATYYRPEPFVVLLALATFWFVLNILERDSLRDHAWLGVMVGLSLALRASSAPLLAPVALAYGVLTWRWWQAQRELMPEGGMASALPALVPNWALGVGIKAVLAGAAALAAFAVSQPYAFIDFQQYWRDLTWELDKTAGSVPYTVQYIGIPRNGVYEVTQSAVWGLGLPLGIAAWSGLALTIGRMFRRPRLADALVLALVVPSLLVVMSYEVKFLRYLVMVLPFMVLLGSDWLVTAWRRTRMRSPVLFRAVVGFTALVLVATVFFGLAFASTYAREHPGVQASEWMNANAEQGSLVLTDNHWDEGFRDLWAFDVRQLPMFNADTGNKVSEVSASLAEADYIMAYSNRTWGSIARVPERYPYSAAYYQALFSGDLGYELVQAFARYPTLAGVTFAHDPFTRAGVQRPDDLPGLSTGWLTLNLGYADENVVNYDRPLTLVWRNTGGLSGEQIAEIMLEGEVAPRSEPAMLSPEEQARHVENGTWTDLFTEDGLNGAVPWLVWLLVVEVIFLATLPLSVRLFRWLPDRGVVLARPLGLLLVAWLVWMGASLGVWAFSRLSVFLAIALVALVSGVLLYRNWRFMAAHARRHWRYLVSVEVLFLAAFIAFVLIRAANPDLWHPFRGGEKPMDLAYLTAVVKSSVFPAYDPWYAGGFINYYYFGFVIAAVLIKATAIVPEVAYNLALPLFFALTLTGAFAVGYNLAESFRRHRPHLHPGSSLAAGAAAALLVAVLANVDGAIQLAQGAARWVSGGAFGPFDFWRSSRLMPSEIAINEFPYWTFLFGDLHAHLISLPVQVLILGLLVNVVLSARAPVSMLRRVPALAVAAWAVGSLAAINTWDVPAYGLLAVGAVGIVVLWRHRGPPSRFFLHWLAWTAAFWAVLYLAWQPFHAAYEAPLDGIRVSEWRTVLWHYLQIHALLLFLTGSWLVYQFRDRFFPPGTLRVGGRHVLAIAVGIGVFALVWFSVPVLRQWTTVLMLAGFLFMAGTMLLWWLLRRSGREAPQQAFLLCMVIVAFGIGAGVDFVTLGNDIDRMNTVFKLYLNAWVLFGIVGGVGLWQLWAAGALRGGVLPKVWLSVLAVLVLASSVFLVWGTHARLSDRFDPTLPLTLDGMVYQQASVYQDAGPANGGGMAYALHHDAEALEFMRRNIEGSPVVLEGVTPFYRWTPRVAKYTGLPVVVGYEWHQIQQRGVNGGENVRQRTWEVQSAYDSTDAGALWDVVDRYGVEYIYVGPAERLYFAQEGIAKFEDFVGEGLEVFFSNDEVRVYRVTGGG